MSVYVTERGLGTRDAEAMLKTLMKSLLTKETIHLGVALMINNVHS